MVYEDATKRATRPDVFADQFRLNFNPNGALMLFQRTNAFDPPLMGPNGENLVPYEEVAQVRVTPAHLKQIVYLAWRTIVTQAKDVPGGEVPVPIAVLEGMGIDLAEWQAFWGEAASTVEGAADALNPQPEPAPVVSAAAPAAVPDTGPAVAPVPAQQPAPA